MLFVFVLTHGRAFSFLKLHEKGAAKRPQILKPFSRRFSDFGQAPSPHQSRESQASVKHGSDLPLFSCIVTPYRGRTRNENVPKLEISLGTFLVLWGNQSKLRMSSSGNRRPSRNTSTNTDAERRKILTHPPRLRRPARPFQCRNLADPPRSAGAPFTPDIPLDEL